MAPTSFCMANELFTSSLQITYDRTKKICIGDDATTGFIERKIIILTQIYFLFFLYPHDIGRYWPIGPVKMVRVNECSS